MHNIVNFIVYFISSAMQVHRFFIMKTDRHERSFLYMCIFIWVKNFFAEFTFGEYSSRSTILLDN